MSMAISINYTPSVLDIFSNIGFSDESNKINDILQKEIDHNMETETIGRPLKEAFKSLIEVYNECSEADWDGYDATPVSLNVYNEARKLINLLPLTMSMPEIAAEPSGDIGLEWYKDKRAVFVVSVDGKSMITYAGIFGLNKTHGSEYFGESLPRVIIENLNRLYS